MLLYSASRSFFFCCDFYLWFGLHSYIRMCDSIRISVLPLLGAIYCIVLQNYSASDRVKPEPIFERQLSAMLHGGGLNQHFDILDGFLWSFFHSCSLRLMRNVVFLSAFHIKDTVRCQPGEFCPPVTLFVTGLVVLSASLIENHHKTSKTRSTCLPELMPHMKHWNTDEEVSFKRTWKNEQGQAEVVAACSESVFCGSILWVCLRNWRTMKLLVLFTWCLSTCAL